MPLYEVLEDGTVKQVAGNTHTNYTAGNGMNIDENNVISVPTKPYASYKFPAVNINSSSSPSAELTIATTGRPVYISLTGDVNPISSSVDNWCRIYVYRDGVKLTTEIVTDEKSSANRPFAVTFLDQVSAGTHTYKVQFVLGGNGELQFGEEDGAYQTPDFTVFEI